MSRNVLVCTPLSKPENAFARMAAELRATNYTSAAQVEQARGLVSVLDFLAASVPEASHVEPVMLAAIARMGVDARERQRFFGILSKIEQVLATAAQAQAQAGAAGPPGTFRL